MNKEIENEIYYFNISNLNLYKKKLIIFIEKYQYFMKLYI